MGKYGKRPPIRNKRECRNINLLCIDYAFRPCLSSRLTLGRFALPRKPWVYGGQDSHLPFCYLCQHSLFASLHRRSPLRLQRNTNAPLPSFVEYFGRRSPSFLFLNKNKSVIRNNRRKTLSFGTSFSPGTFSAQEGLTSELLRYL